MTNTHTTETEILSIHTLTYRYRCSLQTYYGLFQYLVQNRNCIFTKRKHKKCEKYTTRTLHPLGFNRIEFIDCMIPDRDYHEYKTNSPLIHEFLPGKHRNHAHILLPKNSFLNFQIFLILPYMIYAAPTRSN